jgi:hypothetical protein
MFSRSTILAASCVALVAVPSGTGAFASQGSSQGPAPIQQTRHWNGQGVAPVYEGFDINPDGTFNMWFGYMNRNFEEQLDIPVGADNRFEPGSADRGQPTHFDPRRRKDIFRVVVPKDFGAATKLVWSVTVHGKTESVAGILNRVWQIDRLRTTRGGNSESVDSNTPPVVDFQPATQTVSVGQPATLSISATDDGLPKRRGRNGGEPAPIGMTVEFEKYRGPGNVTFSSSSSSGKPRLADGKASATATFSAPGEYMILSVVDDGSGESAGNFGYHCCWTDNVIKVVVRP